MTWTIDVRAEPPGPIEAGADVWVWVKAEASEATTCRAIQCQVSWSTRGRGTPDTACVFEGRADGGPSQPGSPLTAEFHFAVPAAGPITYSGTLIRIDWQVRVWLDLAWTQDPEASTELVVVPRRS